MAAFIRPIYINKRAFAKQDHGEVINGRKYSRMDKVKSVEGSLLKKLKIELHHFKFFKGCLPQFLLGPFLNILSQMNRKCFSLTLRPV